MNQDRFGYETTVWDSLNDIDRDSWNKVREPDDLYTDLSFLQAIENSTRDVARCRYALIRDPDGRPVAITPLATFVAASAALATDRFMVAASRVLDKIAPFLSQYRMLFCGFPVSGAQNSLRIVPDADVPTVLGVLDAELQQIARHDRAKYVVIKEYDDDGAERFGALRSLGYLAAPSLNNNELEMTAETYDDYLMSLSKKRRHEVRRYARRMEAANMRIITTSDIETIERLMTDDVHRLYLNVVDKSATVFETMPLEFFREVARRLPENSEYMFCLDENDRVCGFALSLFFGETYQYLYCGLDYDANAKGDLYFNMMFRMVENAIRQGKRYIMVGQNADECKHQKIETFQTPRSCFVKGADVLSHASLKLFFPLLFPKRPMLYPRTPVSAEVRTPVDEEAVEV